MNRPICMVHLHSMTLIIIDSARYPDYFNKLQKNPNTIRRQKRLWTVFVFPIAMEPDQWMPRDSTRFGQSIPK